LDSGIRLLVGGPITQRERLLRLIMFLVWLALVAWLVSGHVFWRDEVRAFSLALSGSNVVEMLRNVHGEGHPALWYLILRGAHDLFPYREVLPAAGALIGVSAMAIVAFWSPFRTIIVGLILFSLYSAFDYAVIARNYGISALVMFALAALYQRVRNSIWFGVILAILCNTNVPSCLLAAAFLLFRFVEMVTDDIRPTKRDLLVFGANILLATIGAFLCFITVYPTFNDEAISPNLGRLSAATVVSALLDQDRSFFHLGFGSSSPLPMDTILLAIACLGLIRRPAALAAGITGLVAFKLFFYFVYFSSYRHEALYLVFLLSLFWMVAQGAGGGWRRRAWHGPAQFLGTGVLIALLVLQTGRLLNPVHLQIEGIPASRAADLALLLKRPELSGAIVMGDPDTMLEPLPYYAGNPIWFLRQQRFGHVVRLSTKARHELGLVDFLADAQRLHQLTGRPVVFLSQIKLQDRREERIEVMFRVATVLRPNEVRRFWSSTRLVARLRPAASDEDYDVYVYPR